MKLTTLAGLLLVTVALLWDTLGGAPTTGLPAVNVPLFYRSSVALAAAYLLAGRGARYRPLLGGVGAVACLGRVLLTYAYVPDEPLRTAWLAVDVVGAVLWVSVTVMLLEGVHD